MIEEFKLRKIRLQQQSKLDEASLFLFRDITSYIWGSKLTMHEKEEILGQILDMLLQANQEKRNVEFIIGKDYEVFCDSIIEEYLRVVNFKEMIFRYFESYVLLAFLLVSVICLIDGISNSHGISIKINDFLFVNIWVLFYVLFGFRNRRTSIKNYIESKNFLVYLFQNINTYDKKFKYYIIYAIVCFFSIRYLLIVIYGFGIMNHYINLLQNYFIIIGLLVLIIAIEIYKINFTKKTIKKV